MLHRLIGSIRALVEAFRRARSLGQPQAKDSAGSRRKPWPRCQACHHRVPVLRTSAPEGAEPCFFGIQCGCCYGPHRPPKPAGSGAQDGGMSQTALRAHRRRQPEERMAWGSAWQDTGRLFTR
jgi:hypothetical protein